MKIKIDFINLKDPKLEKRIQNDLNKFIDTKIPDDKLALIGIHFISASEIRKINNKYRNIDKATDVLSFPIYNNIKEIKSIISDEIDLGDIFICPDVAKKQFHDPKFDLNKELIFLSVHGLKHLLGFHHKE